MWLQTQLEICEPLSVFCGARDAADEHIEKTIEWDSEGDSGSEIGKQTEDVRPSPTASRNPLPSHH